MGTGAVSFQFLFSHKAVKLHKPRTPAIMFLMNAQNLKGKLVLIVGPSGSGKGTVIEELKKRHSDWFFPPSCTTRPPRPSEKDGAVYHFMSEGDFKAGIESGEFLEWAEVHKKNFYGTLRKPIFSALEQGKTVVREVDIQGFKSIKSLIPAENLTSIFLIVENLDELKARILKRGPMTEEEISRRMQSAKKEISESHLCDYRVPSPHGKIPEITAEVERIILSNKA
ncbi:guanylate kinase [Candidatus Peregrinibacteria bacterium]|nr:guanylate kinase [Candidatus Peregrinibacteria bacterium]